MLIHQTSTLRNSPAKASDMGGLCVSHKAQVPNAMNATDSSSRSEAHGRFE